MGQEKRQRISLFPATDDGRFHPHPHSFMPLSHNTHPHAVRERKKGRDNNNNCTNRLVRRGEFPHSWGGSNIYILSSCTRFIVQCLDTYASRKQMRLNWPPTHLTHTHTLTRIHTNTYRSPPCSLSHFLFFFFFSFLFFLGCCFRSIRLGFIIHQSLLARSWGERGRRDREIEIEIERE